LNHLLNFIFVLSEPNFYETIEEVVNGPCAESVFTEQAIDGSILTDKETTINATASPSGPDGAPLHVYHRSRVCTPSPRRRWTLKPLLPGGNPALTGSTLQLTSAAIYPGTQGGGIATEPPTVGARNA
jgi:hypothetical protein